MQQRILNILSYLSQSLLQQKDLFYDAQEIWEGLTLQGFSDEEIESALQYIESSSLKVPGPFCRANLPVHRVYTTEEKSQITQKARGYLWGLKSRGIIDHGLEDEIIEKAMNLDHRAGIREIKTVAALTLFGYEHQDDSPIDLSLPPSKFH